METGRKFSEEHKRKISISNMGKKCPWVTGEMSFFDFVSHIETILNNVKSSGTFKVRVIQ